METLPFIFALCAVLSVVVLTVVGVQLFFVLREAKQTLVRINGTIDSVEHKMTNLVAPLQGLGGIVGGLNTGIRVFESFVGWLHREKVTDVTPRGKDK